jgi:hypothetical protein
VSGVELKGALKKFRAIEVIRPVSSDKPEGKFAVFLDP